MGEREKKEWIVTGNITLGGVWAVIEAATAEEARQIANSGGADWELGGGDLRNWEVTNVSENT